MQIVDVKRLTFEGIKILFRAQFPRERARQRTEIKVFLYPEAVIQRLTSKRQEGVQLEKMTDLFVLTRRTEACSPGSDCDHWHWHLLLAETF